MSGTCPEPGGCDSCPDPSYCAGLRAGTGLTSSEGEAQAEYGVRVGQEWAQRRRDEREKLERFEQALKHIANQQSGVWGQIAHRALHPQSER